MTDSEDLRAAIDGYSDYIYWKMGGSYVTPAKRLNKLEFQEVIETLLAQALTKERQRIVAALPERASEKIIKDIFSNDPYQRGYHTGINEAIDQAKQAINNQQSKGYHEAN